MRQGRLEFLAQFPSLAAPEMQAEVPDPSSTGELRALQARPGRAAQERRGLRPSPRPAAAPPRRPGLPPAGRGRARRRGARAGGARAALLRAGKAAEGRRPSPAVNLGADLHLASAPEPLLAPPLGCRWRPPLVERGPALRRLGRAAARGRRRLADRRPRGDGPDARPDGVRAGAPPRQEAVLGDRQGAERGGRRDGAGCRALTAAPSSASPISSRRRRPPAAPARAAAAPRVAGHQRPGRLRLGHRRRRLRPGAITACWSPPCPPRSAAR